jgi:hypothetical protein
LKTQKYRVAKTNTVKQLNHYFGLMCIDNTPKVLLYVGQKIYEFCGAQLSFDKTNIKRKFMMAIHVKHYF